MSAPAATVLIPTRDRREEALRAVESALAQTVPVEVIVMDDGSTDGTADAVRERFPDAVVHRSERSLTSVVQRNLGVRLARAPVVFSLDDDAVLVSPRTVEQTLAELEHPHVGIVAVPYVDVPLGPEVKQRAPDGDRVYATWTYTGCAAAFRRDLFLAVGGYRRVIRQQGEEPDLAIRMLDAGFVTRLGLADPVDHFHSTARDFARFHRLGARNQILYAWHNVPMPYLPAQLAASTLGALRLGLEIGEPRRKLEGLAAGYAAALRELWRRRPVARSTYRLVRRMHRAPLPLDALEPLLPPPAAVDGPPARGYPHRAVAPDVETRVSRRYLGAEGEAYYAEQHAGGRTAARLAALLFDSTTQSTDVVLDFGCGNGLLLAALPAARRIGVEVNPEVREAATAAGIEMHAATDELASDSVDVVISNHALEHTLQPFRELVELCRVVRPGGRLVLVVPCDDWRAERDFRAPDIHRHVYGWTPLTLANLVTEAGFAVEQSEVVTHAWPPFYGLLARLPRPAFSVCAWATAVLRRRRQLRLVARRPAGQGSPVERR